MRRIGIGAAAVIIGALIVNGLSGSAVADHQPADKVAVAGSTLETMDVVSVEGMTSEEVVLFATSMRTSSPTDLIIQVTAECALWTDITNMGNSDSEAVASVKVWVEFDDVPVKVAGDGEGTDLEKAQVVFCNRAYRTVVTDLDDEDATFERFLATRNANSFNWILINTGGGVKDIVVKAELEANVTGVGRARALVGNRTLVVEPTKLPNDATI